MGKAEQEMPTTPHKVSSRHIKIATEVVGYHAWPDAPDRYAWLRQRHRHKFYIEGMARVAHNDRDREFCVLATQIQQRLHRAFGNPCEFGSRSCEWIAEYVARAFDLSTCVVLEDNENGGGVTFG